MEGNPGRNPDGSEGYMNGPQREEAYMNWVWSTQGGVFQESDGLAVYLMEVSMRVN